MDQHIYKVIVTVNYGNGELRKIDLSIPARSESEAKRLVALDYPGRVIDVLIVGITSGPL